MRSIALCCASASKTNPRRYCGTVRVTIASTYIYRYQQSRGPRRRCPRPDGRIRTVPCARNPAERVVMYGVTAIKNDVDTPRDTGATGERRRAAGELRDPW